MQQAARSGDETASESEWTMKTIKSMRIPPQRELDLQCFYEATQAVDRGDQDTLIPGDFVVCKGVDRPNGVRAETISAIRTTLANIIGIVEKNDGFDVTFMELSFFDPDDPTSRTFRTVLCGPSKKSIDDYRRIVIDNMKGDPDDNEVGPLVPNLALYQSPFYDVPASSVRPGVSLDHSIPNVFVGGFKAITPVKLAGYDDDDEFELVQRYIQSAFDRTLELISDAQGTAEINTCLMVPFSRPASTKISDLRLQVSGGVLFLYGERKGDQFDSRSVGCILSTLLSRALLAHSHDRHEVLQVQRSLYLTQGLFAHHLKNMFHESARIPDQLTKVKQSVTKAKRAISRSGESDTAGVLGDAFEQLDDLTKEFELNRVTASDFREMFDMLSQSSLDHIERASPRIEQVLARSSCRVRDVVDSANQISAIAAFDGKPQDVSGSLRLPGSQLIYFVILNELIRNAERAGAREILVRLSLGDEVVGTQSDGALIGFEVLDDGTSEVPDKHSRRSSGLQILETLIRDVLRGRFSGLDKRSDGTCGAAVRFAFKTADAFHAGG